ncbi:RloB domain-containing protein [Paenibacillus periandrae]|uniref:RloB domain-containing protein n=1 Tax=Paenibacillus periandrae TaxID=1761741 RepID=UPI001F088F3A|nr:RloB domain-containing protein [Paenibacillus periandrae]
MSPQLKNKSQHYFSVEGETEKWYLDWLQDEINAHPAATKTAVIRSKVEKNPISYAKSLNIISKTVVTHWFDYESNDQVHVTQFLETLALLKEANRIKQIKYLLGYSNLTFELWMVLHKQNCNGHVTHRDHYIRHVNSAFTEDFPNLNTYKAEANFKRCLRKLTINDVKAAIDRAKYIMQQNQQNSLQLYEHCGFKYYRDNPSLTIHESVERILKDCGLL